MAPSFALISQLLPSSPLSTHTCPTTKGRKGIHPTVVVTNVKRTPSTSNPQHQPYMACSVIALRATTERDPSDFVQREQGPASLFVGHRRNEMHMLSHPIKDKKTIRFSTALLPVDVGHFPDPFQSPSRQAALGQRLGRFGGGDEALVGAQLGKGLVVLVPLNGRHLEQFWSPSITRSTRKESRVMRHACVRQHVYIARNYAEEVARKIEGHDGVYFKEKSATSRGEGHGVNRNPFVAVMGSHRQIHRRGGF